MCEPFGSLRRACALDGHLQKDSTQYAASGVSLSAARHARQPPNCRLTCRTRHEHVHKTSGWSNKF